MPTPALALDATTLELLEGLARIREEFDVPGPHGVAAQEEASARSAAVLAGLDAEAGTTRTDARDVPLLTIDPPGSMDLDQALHLEPRAGGGWRVRYAIADVGAFVRPGGSLAAEVQERGLTFYLPDERAPLHPPVLGEGAGSLLPGEDRPAVLWTIELEADGTVDGVDVRRAVVRSRRRCTYSEVQAAVDAGTAEGTLAHLATVGRLRQAAEAARDGVSLDLPTQRVRRGHDGRFVLAYETVVEAMGWNAQISLLTGMVAADLMLSGGVGLLRTLPPPDHQVIATVRRTARALDVPWPEGVSYQSVVRGLDGSDPDEAAVLAVAARGLRGAGYLTLRPGRPRPEHDALEHAAVAAPYAHVTAPLRRLCDRTSLEVCLALHGGQDVPGDVVAALDLLPKAMAQSRAREGGAARAAVDLVEALLLQPLVGEVVEATVVSADEERSAIVVDGLAVQATVAGVRLPVSEVVPLRIEEVDVRARHVRFVPV